MSLFTDASLVVKPSLYKAGKLYSIKPGTGLGDLSVVRNSVKWGFGPNGVLRQVAANVPLIEYDPVTRVERGLLVEPGATNLMIQSQDLALALSSQSNSVVTANSAVAPDGTTTADTLSFSNTNGYRLRSFSIASGTTYTASVFIKNNTYASGETLRINISDGVAGPTTAIITPFTNTVSSSGNPAWTNRTATIQDVGNGWYRVTVSGTAGNTGTGWVEFSSSSVVNKEIFVWQLQFETGSVATSPMVTSGSTFNRVADVVSLTGASSLIGATEGTIYAEVVPRNYTASVNRRILNIRVDANNVISVDAEPTIRRYSFVVTNGGVNQAGIASGDIMTDSLKLAGAYKVNDFAFYINGNQIGTDVSGTVPDVTTGVVGLGVRGDGAAGTEFNGHIRSVVLSPIRKNNAELAAMTTL
jgi:hypothetical protein